ncbi:hypothetical protein J4573_10980 [Actinomadura barringtoniae]|uniref:Peptidase S1 domain-containing protein n=1 Tax=Actinomadura barringtoniae TaxID=1427535 RepID=A0A939P820_9ACTN|nr:hypothetical protein [Actinomadura barringtoniae]MBO2447612.1 hypothetical protein [Actinomadura barringtoniae]
MNIKRTGQVVVLTSVALMTGIPAGHAGQRTARADHPAGKILTPHGDDHGYARWPKPYTRHAWSRITGKLLSDAHGEVEPCTASVIRSRSRMLLVSAAHCVRDPGPKGRFFTNIRFVPAYSAKADPDTGKNYDVRAPYGTWRVRKVWVTKQWRHTRYDFNDPNPPVRISGFDVSVLSVAPKNGRRIQDVVGGFAPVVSAAGRFRFTTLGYPGGGIAPYLGNLLERCVGRGKNAPRKIGPGAVRTRNCWVIPGHSGGPWIVPGRGVIAVTSSQVARSSLGARLKPTTFGPLYRAADLWSLHMTGAK